MTRKSLIFVFLGALILVVRGEDVLFPYGEKFSSVELSDIPEEERGLYDIPVPTGSLLFDSEATTSTLKKKLAMNIQVERFKAADARYFRAHPVFLKCAEQTIIKLLQQDIAVTIVRGYITADQYTGSERDLFHQSGSGMELAINGDTGNVEDIAAAVLKSCPAILERELRDLGLVIMPDRVHFRMSEPDSQGPIYITDGYTGIPDLSTWVQTKINEGLEPLAASTCEKFSVLYSGDHYPQNNTQFEVVETLDSRITRNMTKDFQRLIQYQGSDMLFENAEESATWCDVTTSPCPSLCADMIQGNSIANRCADRVMSPRLLGVLKKVAKKVRTVLQDTLLVLEAWDESFEGYEDGDSGPADTLHYEGRAARITCVSGDSTKLGDVAKFAACFGADYVEHRGTYIYLSVKRMKAGGSKTTFPNIDLLSVEVPEAVESLYALPSVFSEADAASYPLFDKDGKVDTLFATGITLGQFVSKAYRYFRLNPKLVECYRDVVYSENQRKQDGETIIFSSTPNISSANAYNMDELEMLTDPDIEIEILRGFLTNRENKNKIAASDKRYNSHTLGKALQLRYKPAVQSSVYTPYRLLKKTIDKCAYRFYEDKMSMGLGLYNDSIFVDLRATLTIMQESFNYLPADFDRDTFETYIEERYELARDRRIVDPDDYATACLFQRAPSPQDPAFVHVHSEVVKRKRRRRRSAEVTEGCIPTSDTNFCRKVNDYLGQVTAKLTTILDRKHYTHRSRSEILDAMNGCFGVCGTCLEGDIYEDKTYHCNNFLHWVNWTLSNKDPDVSNFFVSMTQHACENRHDCIENSPLFSLIAPSYWRSFRPDPTKSVEEYVYSSAQNPSPVMALLEDIYAIQARGRVKFWVKDDTEMTALKRQLEVVMLYNKDVTHIDVYVERYKNTKDAVIGIIEKAARTMAKQGCPEHTRETLTPYSVHEVPEEKRARAAVEARSVKYKLRKERLDIDRKWDRVTHNYF